MNNISKSQVNHSIMRLHLCNILPNMNQRKLICYRCCGHSGSREDYILIRKYNINSRYSHYKGFAQAFRQRSRWKNADGYFVISQERGENQLFFAYTRNGKLLIIRFILTV